MQIQDLETNGMHARFSLNGSVYSMTYANQWVLYEEIGGSLFYVASRPYYLSEKDAVAKFKWMLLNA